LQSIHDHAVNIKKTRGRRKSLKAENASMHLKQQDKPIGFLLFFGRKSKLRPFVLENLGVPELYERRLSN
jgi:hypothetical protein